MPPFPCRLSYLLSSLVLLGILVRSCCVHVALEPPTDITEHVPPVSGREAMGFSTDITSDGRRMAVGTNLEVGRVYVYERGPSNRSFPSSPTHVLSSGGDLFDAFGASVSLSQHNDLLVVGEPGFSTFEGRVFVFQRNSSGWEQKAILSAPVGASAFGSRVAVDTWGKYILATSLDTPSPVFKFTVQEGSDFATWNSAGLMPDTTYMGADPRAYSFSISFDGTVAVGFKRANLGRGEGFGMVQVFREGSVSPVGIVYVNDTSHLPNHPEEGTNYYDVSKFGEFGTSVALSPDGKFLMVGANAIPIGGGSAAVGCVLVYETDALDTNNSAVATQALLPSRGSSDYGSSISISSPHYLAAVGAPGDDYINGDQGLVYVYKYDRNQSLWVANYTIAPGTDLDGMEYGFSLALSFLGFGVVGAPETKRTFSNQIGRAESFFLPTVKTSAIVSCIYSSTSPDYTNNLLAELGIPEGCETDDIMNLFAEVDVPTGQNFTLGTKRLDIEGSFRIPDSSRVSVTLNSSKGTPVNVAGCGQLDGALDLQVDAADLSTGPTTFEVVSYDSSCGAVSNVEFTVELVGGGNCQSVSAEQSDPSSASFGVLLSLETDDSCSDGSDGDGSGDGDGDGGVGLGRDAGGSGAQAGMIAGFVVAAVFVCCVVVCCVCCVILALAMTSAVGGVVTVLFGARASSLTAINFLDYADSDLSSSSSPSSESPDEF